MSNQFIKINNELIKGQNENGINTFKLIGTEGFTLYTYLLYQQNNNQSTNISIRMIQSFLCRNYNKRPELNYKNKNGDLCRVSLIKDRKTILNYIEFLHEQEYIIIHNLDDLLLQHNKFSSIGLNDIFIVSCNYISKDKYTLIPSDIFLDYIHKIGHIGWSLLVILSNLHNENFGNNMSNGFAYPKEEYLAETINKGITSTKQYLYLLDKLKLIKIEEQPPIRVETPHGIEFTYLRNNYIVNWKLKGNKYNITINGNKTIKKEYTIEELKAMPYKEYLETDHWKGKRRDALKRAKYKCQLCNSKEHLNVHHNTYENRGCEKDEDLIVLCKKCHSKFHGKEDVSNDKGE